MNRIKLNLPHFFITVMLLLTLSACFNGKPGYWKDGQIPSGIRDDINDLNKKVLTAMQKNDMNTLEGLMSKEMIEDKGMISLAPAAGIRLKASPFALLNEYYVINKYVEDDTLDAKIKGINNYKLMYPGFAREMYIMLYTQKNGNDKWMLTTIYAKYKYGWRLAHLGMNRYTFNGKTAPELFMQAKTQFQKQHLANAAHLLNLTKSCTAPNDYWVYDYDESINMTYPEVLSQANTKYRFPLVLTAIPTQPRIFGVYNKLAEGWNSPHICYLSKINLKDTQKIIAENEQVKKIIGATFKGIDTDNKYLYYSVYNEMPKATESTDRYDVIQKLK